jgi:hypothetical protein
MAVPYRVDIVWLITAPTSQRHETRARPCQKSNRRWRAARSFGRTRTCLRTK